MIRNLVRVAAVGLFVTALAACSQEGPAAGPGKGGVHKPKEPPKPKVADTKGSLLLSQAQFIYEEGPDGKKHPKPGPARLEMVQARGGSWVSDVLEDPDSNVFHKSLTAEVLGFQGRILTIGANQAFLKLWRSEGGGWKADTLWNPVFGGTHDRLRDVEIGDVTGDGKPEIVIVTHDQGVIAILNGEGIEWEVKELTRKADTFVHEVEIGDVNGNGLNEFYATPSAPNKMDGTPQPGRIVAFELAEGKFQETLVEEFPVRHVKEILVANLGEEGPPSLFAAIEAEMAKGMDGERMVDPVRIKRYDFRDGAYQGSEVGELQDRQCRFLNYADLNGDGRVDLLASGFKSGLWLFEQPDGEAAVWTKTLIDADSSGYEHATLVYDLDEDGKPEIYVAADDQRKLSRYKWDGAKFAKEEIVPIKEKAITFGLMAGVVGS